MCSSPSATAVRLHLQVMEERLASHPLLSVGIKAADFAFLPLSIHPVPPCQTAAVKYSLRWPGFLGEV